MESTVSRPMKSAKVSGLQGEAGKGKEHNTRVRERKRERNGKGNERV